MRDTTSPDLCAECGGWSAIYLCHVCECSVCADHAYDCDVVDEDTTDVIQGYLCTQCAEAEAKDDMVEEITDDE